MKDNLFSGFSGIKTLTFEQGNGSLSIVHKVFVSSSSISSLTLARSNVSVESDSFDYDNLDPSYKVNRNITIRGASSFPALDCNSQRCGCISGKGSSLGANSTYYNCVDCVVGRYTSNDASQFCHLCPENTYSRVVGATACSSCTNFTQQGEAGANVCGDKCLGKIVFTVFEKIDNEIPCLEIAEGVDSFAAAKLRPLVERCIQPYVGPYVRNNVDTQALNGCVIDFKTLLTENADRLTCSDTDKPVAEALDLDVIADKAKGVGVKAMADLTDNDKK